MPRRRRLQLPLEPGPPPKPLESQNGSGGGRAYLHWTRKVKWQMEQAQAVGAWGRYRKLHRKLHGGIRKARQAQALLPVPPPATHCRRGHLLDEKNTIRRGGRGGRGGKRVWRECRACRRLRLMEKVVEKLRVKLGEAEAALARARRDR